MLELLAHDRPTAVVAGNDLLAIGCYDALDETGLSCPDDISVTGFNDMPLIGRLRPPLTSVRVPQYELGVEAARLLLDRLTGRTQTPRVVLLPVSLVVRGSTPPPNRRPAAPPAASRRSPSRVAGSMPRSVSSTRAALRPARPDTEPPGCAVPPVR